MDHVKRDNDSIFYDASGARHVPLPARTTRRPCAWPPVRRCAAARWTDQRPVLAADVFEPAGTAADGPGRKPACNGPDDADGSAETTAAQGVGRHRAQPERP